MDKERIFKIGDIITFKEDVVLEKDISGKKVTIPKGNKIAIGADGLAHHLRDGYIQPFGYEIKLKGYNTDNIAEIIYNHLKFIYPLEEFFEDYDIDKQDFINEISWELSDKLGM